MSLTLRVLVILTSLFLLMITLELVRRGKLREEYSLLFIMWTFASLLLAIFAGTLQRLAWAIGIGYGPSLGFGLAVLLVLTILMVQGSIVSSLTTQNRDLAQKVAELEWQIRQLRRGVQEKEEASSLVWPEIVEKDWNTLPEETADRV